MIHEIHVIFSTFSIVLALFKQRSGRSSSSVQYVKETQSRSSVGDISSWRLWRCF